MKSFFRNTTFVLSLLLPLMMPILPASAQPSDTPNNPFARDPNAPAAGQALFGATCAACHGQGATGGRGPDLTSGRFVHGGSDYEIFQTIRGGVAGTEMPSFSSLPGDDVWRLVTYIKSLSGRGNSTEVAAGDPKAGEALFFGAGNCTSCHEVNGRGRDMASDLSAEGQNGVAAIRTGVMHAARPRPGLRPRLLDVTMKDGRKFSGFTRAEDSFSLDLEQSDGKLVMLDVKDIATKTEAGSMTPASTLSTKQVDDVTAYLAGLKRRDFTETSKASPAPVLPYDRLLNAKAEPQNWATYWGSYDGHHFSQLNQINPANAGSLTARWAVPLLGESIMEATPLVVDGVMYMSGSPGEVYALDARNGILLWSFKRKQDIKNPYQINPFNRGVAVLDGRVFFGTLDDNLIALDAHTGRELWEKRLADTMLGYTLTGAPLALNGKIIVGVAAGEAGVQPWVEAFDPASGNKLWHFDIVPQPGDKNFGTWAGDSWKYGGTASWLTGSYDQGTNTLILGTGNPVPDYNPALRKGDNLYSDCILGLDADTGKLKWYYQDTPNDGHDWDSTEDMVLADQVIDGRPRKLVLHADRNGFFYVLDRTTGKFVFAKNYVRQTWNLGFDKDGKPKVDPKSIPNYTGQVVFPATGGTNFEAPSYDDKTKILYLTYADGPTLAISAPAVNEPGKEYLGRGTGTVPPGTPAADQGIMAIDTTTGTVKWKFPLTVGSLKTGVLATSGGVVFASTGEARFIALDAATGKALWNFRTGQPMSGSPISYAVGGQQYVAVASGNLLFSFALPEKQ
ncbi:MAG TPA: PQQ-dependent dehydrogenase, methanol/ethanol family [Rhizomicrobium sp.]|nr:PQQ-dependent dehydrogenase, methanol/ethanol family [Rhizomicrobium sp.]